MRRNKPPAAVLGIHHQVMALSQASARRPYCVRRGHTSAP